MARYTQFAFKTTVEQHEDFQRFCARQGVAPYGMLRLVVDCWAAGERLIRALEEGRMSQAEVLAELGAIVNKIQVVANANGAFMEAVGRAASRYGVELPLSPAPGGPPGAKGGRETGGPG